MTVPHYVFGGGPLSLAVWVVALIGVGEFDGFESVWGAYASADNGLKEPFPLGVISVVKLGVFFLEVGIGSIVVNVWRDPHKVFAVSWRFEVLRFAQVFGFGVDVLVVVLLLVGVVLPSGDPIFKVFQEGVSG